MTSCNAPRSRRRASATISCAAVAAPRSRHATRSRSGSGLSCRVRNRRRASTQTLNLPLLRVPVLFQIANQRGREMAVGLLAGIHGHVTAELIERLLCNAKRAAIARGADHAGIREARDHSIERRIHLVRRHDLVADRAAGRDGCGARSSDRELHGFRRGQRRGQSPRVSRCTGAARSIPPLHGRVCPRAGLLPFLARADWQSGKALERAAEEDLMSASKRVADFSPDKKDLNPIEIASRDEIAALQLRRMKWSLKHAYENVAHYKKSFDAAGVHPDDLKDLADLRKFPLTSKADLRANYPYGMFAVPMDKIVRIHASSGTTGKPTVVGYSAKDIDTWAGVMARSIRAAGARPGDKVHVAYGYGLFTE